MSTDIGTFKVEVNSLSPEILLQIFLCLESHETVILRSVCKDFLEIIDNNKSLWRILGWEQWEEESPIQALEMFDEKSASTLKEVSIIQNKGGELDARVLGVLDRSKKTLMDVSFTIRLLTPSFRLKMIELAANFHHLKSLVLWPSDELWKTELPKTRLARRGKQLPLNAQNSSVIQLLWYFNLLEEGIGKLDVSSLISFADPVFHRTLEVYTIISKFSTTLIHLSINFDKGQNIPTLSCPSLRILEGRFSSGFPSWLDAPNLQVVIPRDIEASSLQQLPISVEELWLLSWLRYSTGTTLDFLVEVCPQLKVLKLGRELFKGHLGIQAISEFLGTRKDKAKNGIEIEGIKMMSLEKLILPIDLFESAEVDQLRDLVGEVIDIEDYPDFVEIEY